MMGQFAQMARAVRAIPGHARFGTVVQVEEGRISATGLHRDVRIGDICITDKGARAEVAALSTGRIDLIPFGAVSAIAPGDMIAQQSQDAVTPGPHWLGRVVDAFGTPLDGQPLRPGLPDSTVKRPTRLLERRSLGTRLDTGEPALDTLLPLVRGQRLGLFAGSGVGKTSLLTSLAKGIEADVVVFAMIGERGHELATFLNHALDSTARTRAICVAATADASALERRRAAITAIHIAEHFRNRGQHVLFLMDSLTRWAEAHRQVEAAQSGRTVSTGFPANTAQDLARMLEKLGPGSGDQGDITAVLSVLVAGSDMDEPLADMVRGMLDGHIILDRDIAQRGRFPAIDVMKSVSRSLPDAASAEENQIIQITRATLASAARIAPLRDAGLSAVGDDPRNDRLLEVASAIDKLWSARDLPNAKTAFARLAALTRDAT